MLKVGSIMTRELVTVPPDCSIERARWLLRERKLRQLLVVDRERVVGVLSERDVLERPAPARRKDEAHAAGRHTDVLDRMSIGLETVTYDESVSVASRRLLDRRVGCLPVVQNGRLAGTLSESDLLRLYVRVCRQEGEGFDADPPVAKVMSRGLVSVTPRTTAGDAFELCRAKGIRHLPVVQDGRYLGIVSQRDVLRSIGRAEGDLHTVEELMTRDTVGVTPAAALSQAAAGMLRYGFHALPVLARGSLKGIVTSADVLRALCTIDVERLELAWDSETSLAADREEE